METPVTLRLDSKTRRQIARAARSKEITKSEVIRRALNAWAGLAEGKDYPYQLVSGLVGIVRGGNPRRSEKSGKQFRTLLAKRRRGS